MLAIYRVCCYMLYWARYIQIMKDVKAGKLGPDGPEEERPVNIKKVRLMIRSIARLSFSQTGYARHTKNAILCTEPHVYL